MDLTALTEILAKKEQEIHHIIDGLKKDLSEKDVACQTLQKQLQDLEKAFLHNLTLLNDRDKDLDNLKKHYKTLHDAYEESEAELSQVKALLNEKLTTARSLQQSINDMEMTHQQELAQYKSNQEVSSSFFPLFPKEKTHWIL